ncbi:axoneme-associated protein mst101(2) isoform X1 [Procambarus clarkii]|uniref:axoneme-associated protein mst101(2) isoform X1 n=1 Tax=Procambarus clarkii TaxID=6728 RepID=UPI0037435FC8
MASTFATEFLKSCTTKPRGMSNSNKLKKASRDGKIVKHKKKASRDGKIVKHKKKASRDGKIVKHKKASRDGKIVKHKKKASQDRKFVKKMDHQSKKSCAGVCVEDAQECTHGTIVKSKCHDGLKCCVSDEPRVKTEEKRKVCRANKKCTKKNGSCQPKKICSGSIVKGKLCTGGCVCCASVDSSCKTKKSCKAVNGACGPLSQSCSGQLHKGKQYCKGSGCGCCSPTGKIISPPSHPYPQLMLLFRLVWCLSSKFAETCFYLILSLDSTFKDNFNFINYKKSLGFELNSVTKIS